jgi:hypothetical protein
MKFITTPKFSNVMHNHINEKIIRFRMAVRAGQIVLKLCNVCSAN